jgi:hypothetical protein
MDCKPPPLVIADGRLNVDVDGDVGGERRRWGLKWSVGLGESGGLSNIKLDEICIGWEII